MNIDLTDTESEYLKRRLILDFQDLRGEVSGTDSFDYREALKRDEATLRAILSRLGVGLDELSDRSAITI